LTTLRTLFYSIFLLCFSNIHTKQEKFVIGCQPAGFFSIFWGALNHIAWCEKNNKTPVIYWGKQCVYYQPNGYNNSTNCWEYYFEPVSPLRYTQNDFIHDTFAALDNTAVPLFSYDLSLFDPWLKTIKLYHQLIKKYVILKKPIEAKIYAFYNTKMQGKKTIGIHLRGTDKHLELKPIAPEILLDEANKYTGYQYLVATDEARLLDLAKKKLRGPVIAYNAFRSTDGKPVHHNHAVSNALRGEEVLIETILLANCSLLIHTCSNVSISCYYFNPDLKGILFTSQKQLTIN
jgi:hypothetical protein